ncbi:MAG TPA: hypothetical protein VGP55_08405 [Chitinophagaceae bacterium]|nr:hypothetical protein [Chitinophagaceae bacterium]
MNKKIFLAGVTLFFLIGVLTAQYIDSTMNIYRDHFAPEKVHIQTDRLIYKKGETIFYKAYLLASNDLAVSSKTLYIDWYDEAGKLLLQTEAPLFISSAKGSFDIPQNYTGTQLCVKAYTRWMLNFDTTFIYSRTFIIHQKKNEIAFKDNEVAQPVNNTQVQIYPEGGFSVADLTNRIAFKAEDQWGNPVYIKGIIKNSNGRLLDSFVSVHDGMGLFSLLMQKGKPIFLIGWMHKAIQEVKK